MRKEILRFSYEKLFQSTDFWKQIKQLNINVDFLEARRFFATCRPIRGMMLSYERKDVEQGLVRIQENQIILSDVSLTCDVLKEFASFPIKSAMAYLISCSPDSYENYGAGELNYHFIQNACMDRVRNLMMQNFRMFVKKEYETEDSICFSKGVGPGYFGMPMTEGKKIYTLLHGEEIDVFYKGEMMYPLKSTIGAMFSYKAEEPLKLDPCAYCQAAAKDCRYCGEYKNIP
ncbi:hypothetical protein [[Clostridium] polysaccharolyticum]|uniref:Vitamin B12 dependent methionine synthase, activation domain n=1 Tax=[Clostridium] polysaccharolyticum TaxID=29364 RepID=A0A1I0FF26_9FIRM|nr:hypothetical protein [[Clostridium] polysaccharolyticum]SET56565.1 hypothetical protein SAMN04487772_1317 [[Clostridium] polysaccharolyticum]